MNKLHIYAIGFGLLLSLPFSAAYAQYGFRSEPTLVDPNVSSGVTSYTPPNAFSEQAHGYDMPPLPPHYSVNSNSQDNSYNIGISPIPVEPMYVPKRSNWVSGQQPAPSIRFAPNAQTANAKKRGFLQEASVSALWSPGTSGGPDMYQADAQIKTGLPFFFKKTFLGLSPAFQWTHFNWNDDNMQEISTDLYTAGITVSVMKEIASQYKLIFGVTPTYASDWKSNNSSDAFRVSALFVLQWHLNARTDIMLGVLYRYKEDIPALPIAGIVWRPNEDLCFELTFPRPRISQRIYWFGSQAGNTVSDWIYVGGEYGSRSWAVQTSNKDVLLEYSDFRAMLGYERKISGKMTFALEAGYIFGQKFEIDGYEDYEPNGAQFLRARLVY